MNLNYDLATWIDYFIGAFICCFGLLMIGKILLHKSFKEIKLIKIIILVPLAIFMILNTLTFDNILKMFGILLIIFIMFKYILQEKSNKIFIYTLVDYICIIFGEVVYVFSLSIIDYIFKLSLASGISKSIITNLMISIISSLVAVLVRKILMSHIEKINKSNSIIIILQCIFTIFVIISSANYLYIEQWKFSYKFALVAITVLGSTFITFTLIKQYIKNKEVENKYTMLKEYLKTSADLIENHSATLHKYKNNLIIIKGYIKNDIDKADKYVDNLLETFEKKRYNWVNKINNISIESLRYIIYYKLSKAEEINLKIFVNVSKNIKNIDDSYFKTNELAHLLDIIGEYFDNAIYASNESKEKEMNIDVYLLDNDLVFNISNTFKENINLNLINKNGYTTKGKGHGFGLYDIDKTIKSMNNMFSKYEIIDNYFSVTLRVKIKNKENQNKITVED